LKEKKSNNKKTGPKFASILIDEERTVILDCSDQDDYNIVLALSAACGIEQDVETESWCG